MLTSVLRDDILIIKKTLDLNTTAMSFAREEWREVNIGDGFINETRLEISNFGRVRAYNMISKGKILKGSMTNGYRIIRQRLFKPRDQETAKQLLELQKQFLVHSKKVSLLNKALVKESVKGAERRSLAAELESETLLLKTAKSNYTLFYNKDLKKRTTYFGALVHRLVAENFIPDHTQEQTVVAHLDHDKLNNVVTNLKWMTPEENMRHQQLSPSVIADKQKKKQSGFYEAGFRKLSLTKVMYLKKLLNEGVPVRNLAKQFKVTETHIVKIKNKQSWASVEAAS